MRLTNLLNLYYLAEFTTFNAGVTYWIFQKIRSQLSSDREIRVDATGWKELQAHVIDAHGQITPLQVTGFVPPHNPYLSLSPQVTSLYQFKTQFPVFTLKQHEEVSILTKVKIQPKVVDAGHHTRRLMRLTGLDVEENQARRLLNDLDQYRVEHPRPGADEEVLAHEWLSRAFEPVITAIPRNLSGRLEPAEIYHQVLEHRWYMSEDQNRDVPLEEAVHSYIDNVLVNRRDEEAYLSPLTEAITLPNAVPSGTIVVAEDDDEVDWRDLV